MPKCHLDFETYSELDVRNVGSYKYARHPSTEVLICSYHLPGMQRPAVWLPREEDVPADLLAAVNDKAVTFHAFNAQFERPVWKYALRRMHRKLPDIKIKRWRCTAYLAAANGLARSLDGALAVLGSDVTKDPEGSRLIKVFSKPRKPTKADSRTRILPDDSPKDFAKFVRYCRQDVVAEMALEDVLHELHPRQEEFYLLDMQMNERGLPLDMPMVRKTRKILAVLEKRINDEVIKLTGGIRATQRDKMLKVFADLGLELENLKAQTVKDLLKDQPDLDPKLIRLLQLRIEAGKASTKKLASMELTANAEDDYYIVQGSFLIHGAHTGRYAARLIQPQNFIRGLLKPEQQALVFELLDMEDPDLFTMLYDWPIDIISQCMRGFIRAPEGYEFYVVDYTAIEARVLAWVANEVRILQAYRRGVDVYKLMASGLFNVPIEKVTSEQRRLAKNLVLGCGYSLGGKRFVEYCANLGVIIDEKFAVKAVKIYRDQHPAIVQSWKTAEEAAARVIRTGKSEKVLRCKFLMRDHWFCVRLPSGREIRYAHAKATPVERWGRPGYQISFKSDYKGRVYRETTYGGKIIENIVQGIALDIMCEGMFQAEANDYPVHGTVHDELITMREKGTGDIKELEALVCDLPNWTEGIPLGSEGFVCERYRK